MQEEGIRCSICAMVGLPAVGKSSWVQRLRQEGGVFLREIQKVNREIEQVFIEVIEYDKEISYEELGHGDTWKNKRNRVQQQIEYRMKEFLKEGTQRHFLLLFLDDNMFYTSMRRRFYSLSLQYSCSYWQVEVRSPWMSTDSLIALDQLRQAAVGADTILRMSERIEYPDKRTKWEKNTFRVECVNPSVSLKDTTIPCGIFETFLSSIKEASARKQETLMLEANQIETQNIRHSLDLTARAIVNQVINESKQSVGNAKNKVSLLGKSLSDYKKEFFRFLPNTLDAEDRVSLINEFSTHCYRIKDDILNQ